jgi:hypothetical protein
LTGIVQNSSKYIDLPDPELYDLVDDPGERRNRAAVDPRAAVLKNILRLTSGDERTADRAPVDADAAGRLRARSGTPADCRGRGPRRLPRTIRKRSSR